MPRQSNMELCRLASIVLVLLLHTTVQSLGENLSKGPLLLESFTIIGVNVFVLITGYFSATPKKSSLLNLAFICLFWIIIKTGISFGFGETVSIRNLFFITASNWFIPSYICLLFLAPILNTFSTSVSKRTLWGGIFIVIHRNMVRLAATSSCQPTWDARWLLGIIVCHSLSSCSRNSFIWYS